MDGAPASPPHLLSAACPSVRPSRLRPAASEGPLRRPRDSRGRTEQGPDGAGRGGKLGHAPSSPRPGAAPPPPPRPRGKVAEGPAEGGGPRAWNQPMAGRAAYEEANGSTPSGGGGAWGGAKGSGDSSGMVNPAGCAVERGRGGRERKKGEEGDPESKTETRCGGGREKEAREPKGKTDQLWLWASPFAPSGTQFTHLRKLKRVS